jgi:ABC-type polysaccharide/polyol phosphate export permease
MARLRETLELTRVRVLLFVREPEALFWVFAFPLVLAAVLGFAFRKGDVPSSRVAVLAGAGAEELAATLRQQPRLEVELRSDAAEAARDLRGGSLDLVAVPGDPPHLRLDPQRPEGETARLRVLAALEPGGPGAAAELAVAEPVAARGSRYIDFLFPGLLGMNLMGTGMWSIGFAIAELRQRKLLRRLLVTPMSRPAFLASFLLARLVFLVLELGVLVAFGAWVLGVPFQGSVGAFALVALVGAVSFAGLGLLVTARVRTIQGASGMLNLAMMPMWLGSGVFFSYERFPEVLHPVLRLIPLTSLNDALRALMLDGDVAAALGLPLAILAGWGALSFVAALKLFRWE